MVFPSLTTARVADWSHGLGPREEVSHPAAIQSAEDIVQTGDRTEPEPDPFEESCEIVDGAMELTLLTAPRGLYVLIFG